MSAARKIFWQTMGAAGLEAATFLSWLAEADPRITNGLLALTLAVDLYTVPKSYSFFYKTYKESKDFADFYVKLDVPIFSDMARKARDQHHKSSSSTQNLSPSR